MRRRVSRLLALIKLGTACARLSLSGQKALLPQTVYVGLRQLGGVYVKFLQLLVLRSESFQSLNAYSIYEVYDQVQTEDLDIRSLLQRELGERATAVTLESDQPFAAGSFGQVYMAEYQGRKVILKVLRPTVVNDLNFDLKVLGIFSRIVSLFSMGNAVNMTAVHKEFARATRLETNYILEADYASMLYERYKNTPQLVIPQTYREVSTKNMICQDYVDGIAGTELIKARQEGVDIERYLLEHLGSDLKQQLVTVGSEMLCSIFFHGIAYGDPHPGNIKFMSGNRVGIIDFGLQAPAPKNTRNFHRLIEEYYKIYSGHLDVKSYSKVLLDMYGGDVIKAAYSLDQYYATDSHKLMDSIVNVAEKMVIDQQDNFKHLLQNNKMLMLFSTVINKNNRFCLKYDLDGPELMRAGNLFISLVTAFGVKNDVLAWTYGSVLERTQGLNFGAEPAELHPETAIEILAGWFDQISYKNPQLYNKIKQEGLLYA